MIAPPKSGENRPMFRREDVPKQFGTWLESVAFEAQKAGATHIRASDVETALVEAANLPEALAKPSDSSRWREAQAIVHKQLVEVRRDAASAADGGRFSTSEVLPDGRVIEEILTPGGPAFIAYSAARIGAKEHWEVVSEVAVPGGRVLPQPVVDALRPVLTLPDGVEEYGTVHDLLRDAEALALEVYDPGKELPVFRLWNHIALSTWAYGPFYVKAVERFAPILRATGPSESGKKRLLTVCRFTTYRAMYFLKTNRVPSIARTLDPWPGATLLLDEADVRDSSESSDLIEFLNSRADGAVMPRYSTESGSVQYLSSFGTTVVAIRKAYDDDGFNSRGVPLKAETTSRDIDLIPPADWVVRARRLQRQLLLFRVRLLARARDGKLELPTRVPLPRVRSHRIRETFLIVNAIAQAEGDPDLVQGLASVAEELGRRLVEEKSHTPEGVILNLVYSALDEGWDVAAESPGFYLVRTRNDDGPQHDEALTASLLSERTTKALSSKSIIGWWRGLVGEPGVKRFRIRDGKVARSVLIVTDVPALNRLFARFVPGAADVRSRFPVAQATLDGVAVDVSQVAQGASSENDSVPLVPLVPLAMPHPPSQENTHSKGGSDVGGVTSGTGVTKHADVPLLPHQEPDPGPDPGDLFGGKPTRADRARSHLEREGGGT